MAFRLKRLLLAGILLSMVMTIPFTGFCAADNSSQPPEGAAELIKQGDALMEGADFKYSKEEIGDFAKAANLYEQAVQYDPDSYEANWKTAKAARYYGEESRKLGVEHWKDICAAYGKKGMHYAQRATEINPKGVEGFYYFGLCSGTYSDGVGLFTALREGLKDKVRDNLETAYEIDKNFEMGGPIIALGRFWQVVPWPYTDKKKAMELYRELQQTPFFDEGRTVQVRIYMAEILVDQRGEEPKEEARRLLEPVSSMTEDPYWIERAEALMKEL